MEIVERSEKETRQKIDLFKINYYLGQGNYLFHLCVKGWQDREHLCPLGCHSGGQGQKQQV